MLIGYIREIAAGPPTDKRPDQVSCGQVPVLDSAQKGRTLMQRRAYCEEERKDYLMTISQMSCNM